ncbi:MULTISPECIES: DUF6274 family protein [Streptomyces]|uniref:DUF6274 family protein n=1 Tax=Streptomyces doudnae TaxID=3075536 RepID=A0ABD5F018_9ACTN|nr:MULTISPECIES: DUF6274 family protein [unclassified Streptomyces]MDT0440233.1 DUF6274 family protein [Streptomyces sp. DSM 41981]MYQ64176.1 hypothetical protein [Streptomyces sp. SID4950]SCD73350.1 hypothetical protein GA0115242_11299 [Streptomyces sp. SolWspMP-5a-2]
MAAPVRHETRALLRAHLSAALPYRHRTRHCPICHRLLRLAMDSGAPPAPTPAVRKGAGIEDSTSATAPE